MKHSSEKPPKADITLSNGLVVKHKRMPIGGWWYANTVMNPAEWDEYQAILRKQNSPKKGETS